MTNKHCRSISAEFLLGSEKKTNHADKVEKCMAKELGLDSVWCAQARRAVGRSAERPRPDQHRTVASQLQYRLAGSVAP